ncbi:hypothetical protein LCGC14_1461870 [marine sediment metagenome]|uniref:Uncharacterized protein n=1 Tax=marine sediment metagenome TaxID=412755 RepID=A0A0F9MGW2_9ZZZZ
MQDTPKVNNGTPELSAEYLEVIAEAIVAWTATEILEEAERDGEHNNEPVISPVHFIATILKRVPAVGGLCLQAGADKHIGYISVEDENGN